MVITDTSAAARRHHVDAWATLDGAQRVALAVEMAEQAKAVAVAGIRARHPHLSDDQVAVEWIRLLHGDEVVAQVT